MSTALHPVVFPLGGYFASALYWQLHQFVKPEYDWFMVVLIEIHKNNLSAVHVHYSGV